MQAGSRSILAPRRAIQRLSRSCHQLPHRLTNLGLRSNVRDQNGRVTASFQGYTTAARPQEDAMPRDDAPAGFGFGSYTDHKRSGRDSKNEDLTSSIGLLGSSITSSKPLVSLRWLRDNCQCAECVHPITRQRQLETFDLASDLTATEAVATTVDGKHLLTVTWNDGHQSVFDADWLEGSHNKLAGVRKRQADVQPRWWAENNVPQQPPTVKYDAVMNTEEGVGEWTRLIRQYGFCFVKETPVELDATQRLLEHMGPIRNTHYGGFQDFTNDLSSKDTAYTSLALPPHNDTTYFTEPIGLQALHMISHTNGSGGESQLVDGFRAAELLRQQDPAAFETLRKVKIWSHASGNDGISIQPRAPFSVLSTDEDTGELYCVRWNNNDRSAFAVDGQDFSRTVEAWYAAAAKFNAIISSNNPDVFYEFKLQPGLVVVFDNWRVLHGRSAFTGNRRMACAYINRDDFISRYKMTNLGQDEVLRSGVY